MPITTLTRPSAARAVRHHIEVFGRDVPLVKEVAAARHSEGAVGQLAARLALDHLTCHPAAMSVFVASPNLPVVVEYSDAGDLEAVYRALRESDLIGYRIPGDAVWHCVRWDVVPYLTITRDNPTPDKVLVCVRLGDFNGPDGWHNRRW